MKNWLRAQWMGLLTGFLVAVLGAILIRIVYAWVFLSCEIDWAASGTWLGSFAVLASVVAAIYIFKQQAIQQHRWNQAKMADRLLTKYSKLEPQLTRLVRGGDMFYADFMNARDLLQCYSIQDLLKKAEDGGEIPDAVYCEYVKTAKALGRMTAFFTRLHNAILTGIIRPLDLGPYTGSVLLAWRATIAARSVQRGTRFDESWAKLARAAFALDVVAKRETPKEVMAMVGITDSDPAPGELKFFSDDQHSKGLRSMI